MIIQFFTLAKPEKLRFKAVVGLTSVFDIDIPVQNVQRHQALVAVRWQVKLLNEEIQSMIDMFLFVSIRECRNVNDKNKLYSA